VPPVEQALRFLEAEGEAVGQSRRITAGTPEQVRAGLETLAHQYGAEIIVVTITHDHAARRRSYELLADAFGLGAMPRARAA